MFIPKVKLVQAILAFTSTLVAANGCYSHGPTFSDLIGGNVDGDIDDFCNNYRGGNRLQMSLENNEGSTQDLSYEDCTRFLEWSGVLASMEASRTMARSITTLTPMTETARFLGVPIE
ncbi:hypothetical protein PG997_011996 [Apiospora hydei]|uniref:Uncharacterized protein n=1 Tax=Apiospora hydei TaxID=1337664 RepID=A0ABR1V236_9PEZI